MWFWCRCRALRSRIHVLYVNNGCVGVQFVPARTDEQFHDRVVSLIPAHNSACVCVCLLHSLHTFPTARGGQHIDISTLVIYLDLSLRYVTLIGLSIFNFLFYLSEANAFHVSVCVACLVFTFFFIYALLFRMQ